MICGLVFAFVCIESYPVKNDIVCLHYKYPNKHSEFVVFTVATTICPFVHALTFWTSDTYVDSLLTAMCSVTVLTVHAAHEVVRREGRFKFLTFLCPLVLSEEMHKVVHNVWPTSTCCVELSMKSFTMKNKFLTTVVPCSVKGVFKEAARIIKTFYQKSF